MAWRAGRPIDVIWVLVNLSHAQSVALENVARTRHGSRLPAAALSVNRSLDGTQALIKIADTEAGFLAALTAIAREAITRVFGEADHDEALELVTSLEWAGPVGNPDGSRPDDGSPPPD